MDPIYVLGKDEVYVKKYRLYGHTTTFKFNPVPLHETEIYWLKRGFGAIVENVKADAQDTDYVGFTLNSLSLKSKEPGYVSFRPIREIDSNVLWDIFGGILQSNQEAVTSSDTFQVKSTRVNVPVGMGKRRPGFYNNFEEECKARRSIVHIKNTDNLCLPRALVVAKAHAKNDPEYILIQKDRAKRQEIKAKKLMSKARVEVPAEGSGICELEKFQAHLKKYKITVFNYDRKGREVYFCGDNPNAQYKINLLFHEGHFNVITSLTGAFACGYFCEACNEPYDTRSAHKCSNICSVCQSLSPPCKLEHNGVLCPSCNIRFKNQNCFVAHKVRQCKNVKRCLECDRLIYVKKRKSEHVCGEIFCKVCYDFKPPNHQCYMQVDRKKPRCKDFLFIFFDLEIRQDDCLESDPDVKVHKVNLCVSQQYCWECIDSVESDGCENCTVRQRVFTEDPVSQFMDYVMEVRKKFATVCVIAHSGQSFDFIFVLRYVLQRTKFTPTMISRGTKIILMELNSVRFVDSLSYFPMPLSALPKVFDLGPEKKKGYFPHLFNTLENQNYIGPIPGQSFYCPDSMFDKNHKAFQTWYKEQVDNNYVFSFQKELVEYCISDVDILAEAYKKFRALFLRECNVDPFLEAVTIASACNLAFRRNFLQPNTISLLPQKGYRLVDKQSKKALQWLSLQERRGVRIQHAGREREVKVSEIKVDGYDGERRVYEFQGCYWHGCVKCYPHNREAPLKEDPSDSLAMRLERTERKCAKLRGLGYEVIEMWECQYDEMRKREKLTHLDHLPVLNSLPLNPRDAFFGGRTDCTTLYYKCAEGEEIRYVDVCSLYPYICKYSHFPIKHRAKSVRTIWKRGIVNTMKTKDLL